MCQKGMGITALPNKTSPLRPGLLLDFMEAVATVVDRPNYERIVSL